VYVGDTLKTLTTHYTVTGAGGSTGGTVVLVTGATAGDIVTIIRDIPIARTSDYAVGGTLRAETLNDDLDKNAMMAQQNEAGLVRKIGLQIQDEDATMELPVKATRSTKILGFDSDGDVTVSSSTVSDIDGVVGAAFDAGVLASAHHFTGDGSTVAFTITGGVSDIPNVQSLIITIDGVTQHTDTYSTSGAVVTFTTAPPLNADIQIRYNAYLGTATDAAGITYSQGGIGASSRTVENKLQESVSVKDFGAVGDGVNDDTTAIQAAIDAANGQEVKLTGQHLISAALELKGNNGTLSGDGWNTSIKLKDASLSGIYLITNDNTTTGNDNWLISGFTIDCNRSGSPNANVGIYLYNSDNNRIENMNIKGASNHCVALEGSNDNWVVNNRITDFESFGVVAIRGSSRNRIIDNNIQTAGATAEGITIDDYSTSGDSLDSAYNIVSGNTITNCKRAINIEGCTHNNISDNVCVDQSDHAIMTSDGSAGDNVRTDYEAMHNLIQGNKIYSPVACGVRDLGKYNVIDDNHIFEAGTYGVYARTCVFSSIMGNTIIMNGTTTNGIRVDGGQQIYVSDNKLSGIGTYGGEGIYITSALGTLQNSDITNNRFFNIGKEGIKVVKDSNNLRQIEIAHNKFYNVSTAATGTDYCIDVAGAVQTISIHDHWWRGAGDAAGLLKFADSDAITSQHWGNVDADSDPFGWSFNAFNISSADAESGTLTGATDKIEVDVPSGALILGVSMNNEATVSDDAGDDTYTAAFSGGNTVAIGGTIAAAQNTKTKQMFDVNATKMVTTSETDITLTPNGGNFDGGNVRAVVWYLMAGDLPDAS
jgi:parallel beta-helix repeat protein